MIKKLLTTLLLAGLLAFTPISVNGQTRDGIEQVETEDVVFTWDEDAEADWYEVMVVWVDPTTEVEYDQGSTENTQMTISSPRPGHFKFKVRSCDTESCGAWAESIDEEPTGWWVFWEVPPIAERVGAEYAETGDITFTWDEDTEADSYEVIAIRIDPTTEVEYDQGSTENTQMTISRPRTGHFKFKVRSCFDSECSAWAESTDSAVATVDSTSKGWWVFWKVPPPTGLIVE